MTIDLPCSPLSILMTIFAGEIYFEKAVISPSMGSVQSEIYKGVDIVPWMMQVGPNRR